MALGVTQQLPIEERHIYPREVIEDSLAVRMGGRAAELLVYGDLSTGASNDLVGNTELARKMVREWGMSEELGPMAWGSQGMVFLGEDLLHSRDYSEDTARVVDAEIARILRQQEERAIELLSRHRGGLDAVARSLLERETLDGSEVGKLVDTAYGRPVHEAGVMAAHFTTANGAAKRRGGHVGQRRRVRGRRCHDPSPRGSTTAKHRLSPARARPRARRRPPSPRPTGRHRALASGGRTKAGTTTTPGAATGSASSSTATGWSATTSKGAVPKGGPGIGPDHERRSRVHPTDAADRRRPVRSGWGS